MDLEGIANP